MQSRTSRRGSPWAFRGAWQPLQVSVLTICRVSVTGAPSGRKSNGCHGSPPPPPHPTSSGCASLLCHGAEVSYGPDGPQITQTGLDLHINGDVDIAGSR